MANDERQLVADAATFLRERLGVERVASLRLGLVLGSGLKDFAQEVTAATTIPFAEIPGWPVPHVGP